MKKLLPYISKFRMWIVGAVCGTMLGAMADLILPMLLAELIDQGIRVGDSTVVTPIGTKMLVVAAISFVGGALGIYCGARFGASFAHHLRSQIFAKVQTFGAEEMNHFGPASLITRNTNDVQQLQQFSMMFLRIFVQSPILLIGGSIMAYQKNPMLAAPLLLSIPLIVLVVLLVSRFIVPAFAILQQKIDFVNRILREQIKGIRVIRAFCTESHENERFDTISKEYAKISFRTVATASIMMPLLTVIMNLTVIAILVSSAYQVYHGIVFEDGTIIAVVQYVMQIMFSLVMMSMMFIAYPRAIASANRINEVLDTQVDVQDLKVPRGFVPDMVGNIEFRNVSFSFPDAQRPTLENISFHAKRGETIAIIGSTGSGKSTVLRLIMRFYDVLQGCILVNGVDIRELSSSELRSRIGYVSQQAQLFSGTIASNLSIGKDATEEEMIHAAKVAQAMDFITEEPDHFSAHVAQNGTNYSGGQKQRLSIARALIRKPEFFLLDDSFSALDAATDLRLRRALAQEYADTTKIIVAQRVSSIAQADQIIVLDHGQVVGMGVHKELLETCPVYREIADSQFSEEEAAV